MSETALGRLQRLMQEAQQRVNDCEEKDRIATAGGIGFNRHRTDPCEALKKELQNLEDQYHRALANADGIQSDPMGNAIAGGIGAGLASGVANLATLAGEGMESLLGDEAAGIAEGAPAEGGTAGEGGTPGEGGTEHPPSTGGEKEPGPLEPEHVTVDDRQQLPGEDPEDLNPEDGGTNPDVPPRGEN